MEKKRHRHIEDQLLASTSSGLPPDSFKRHKKALATQALTPPTPDWAPAPSRSRHSSGLSCMSFDSAIGDVYSTSPSRISSAVYDEGLDKEYIDLATVSSGEASAAVISATTPPTTTLSTENLTFDIINLGDDEFGFRLPDNTVVDSSGNHRKGPERQLPAPTPRPLPIEALHRQQELDFVCTDLMQRFRAANVAFPAPHLQRGYQNKDPLFEATYLLSDSLARMRLFVFNLDPMQWLSPIDRFTLYSSGACNLSIIRASVGVDISQAAPARSLPYGESLGELEALHLILAHDLYNELKGLIAQIQQLGVSGFPLALLIMMVTFFRGNSRLKEPGKVLRIHNFYLNNLKASSTSSTYVLVLLLHAQPRAG